MDGATSLPDAADFMDVDDEVSEEEDMESDEFGIEHVVPEGVYLNTREMSKWRERYEDLLIHYSECPAAFALIEHITESQCKKESASLSGAIKRVGYNPRGVPKYLLDACDQLNTCIGNPAPKLLLEWIKHCGKAPISLQRPPSWINQGFRPELKFCQDVRPFVEDESTRASDAAEFRVRYGKFCPA
jgi:hypothetical protein